MSSVAPWVHKVTTLAIALAIWVGTSGFGFYSLLFERTTAWKEEVLLSDGKAIWINRTVVSGADAFFRPGRGGTAQTTLTANIPGIGEVTIDRKGHEIPISFDVVGGLPWIVIPIAGEERCAQYGYPKESVAAFYLNNGKWTWTPFENAPKNLRNNILGSPPIGKTGTVSLQSSEKKIRHGSSYGLPLAEKFIPEHIKWEHSCPRISPLPDLERDKSTEQFRNLVPKTLEVMVLSTHSDTIHITRREDYRGVLAIGHVDDEFLLVGCSGKITRAESIRPVRKLPDGSMHSKTSAIRISLSEAIPSRSLWLPMEGLPGAGLRQIRCAASHNYAILSTWNSKPGLLIASFGLDGLWKEIFQFEFPKANFRAREIIEFNEIPGGFQVAVGEIDHNSNWHTDEPLATIGSRYILEATRNR